jgi:predicted acetyltransferase
MTDADRFELRPPQLLDEPAFHVARAVVPADHPRFLRGYAEGMSYQDWLRLLADQRAGRGLPDGTAASTLLLAFVDGVIVGRASLRHALLGAVGERDGHVGYGVLPPYRRRGVGARILRGAVRHARDVLGIDRVLVTCHVANLASRRVIETCGGRFESSLVDAATQRTVLRFWIDPDTAQT